MDSIDVRRVALVLLASLTMLATFSGTVQAADQTVAAFHSELQRVEVRGLGAARFQARGAGRFTGDSGPFDGEASLRTDSARYTFDFNRARVIRDASGSPVGLELRGRGRLIRDGQSETFDVTATVRPDASGDCLIYDFLGPPDRLSFEAEGTLRISG